MQIVQCPTCGATARAPKPGRYRCAKCGATIEWPALAPEPPPMPSGPDVFAADLAPFIPSVLKTKVRRSFRYLGILWSVGILNAGLGIVCATCLWGIFPLFANLAPIDAVFWAMLCCSWSIKATGALLGLRHVPADVIIMMVVGCVLLGACVGAIVGVFVDVDPRSLMLLNVPSPQEMAVAMKADYIVLLTIAGAYAGSLLSVRTLMEVDRLQEKDISRH